MIVKPSRGVGTVRTCGFLSDDTRMQSKVFICWKTMHSSLQACTFVLDVFGR